MDRLLSTDEVAHVLNISTRTARRLADARVIPGARKIGRSWRFDPKKFREWLNRLEQPEEKTSGSKETIENSNVIYSSNVLDSVGTEK